RRDDVGAGLGVADRRTREQLEAPVVVGVAVDDDAAVAVRRVLAETDVGEEDELREARPERPQRDLDDSVLLPGAGRLLVLDLRDTEQDDGPNAAPRQRLRLAQQPLDVETRHPRQRLV